MKINELLKSVAHLVQVRKTIDHGAIRCIYSDQRVRDIEACEACEEVDTGEVGDDELTEELGQIVEDEREGQINFDALKKLENAYRGDDLDDYLLGEQEDELKQLDTLVEAARQVV